MAFKVGHVLRPAAERFREKTKPGPNGCIVWTAGTAGRSGYGYFYAGRKSVDKSGRVYAHRWAYEHFVGPIPDGLHIDHLCRNPPCVNPDHLEPVTPYENVQRSMGNHRKTHCPAGHPYAGDNLRKYGNARFCRECSRIRRGSTRVNNVDKTHCDHGHPFDDLNTYITPQGRRKCRICRRATAKAYRARKKNRSWT